LFFNKNNNNNKQTNKERKKKVKSGRMNRPCDRQLLFIQLWWIVKAKASSKLNLALKYGVKRPIKMAMYGCLLWAFILILIGCIVYAAAAPRASYATLGYDTKQTTITNAQYLSFTLSHYHTSFLFDSFQIPQSSQNKFFVVM
jgi:Ni,Fe-hydrogenase I cytochrome b subunit